MVHSAKKVNKNTTSRTGTRPPAKKKNPVLRPSLNKNSNKKSGISTREMKQVLVRKFGLQCWGCDFIAPREQYLQMDHIDPKSLGGSNGLDNRALLCAPCNSLKSNTKTLIGLRLENLQRGHSKREEHPIDVMKARAWCRKYIRGKVTT